MVNRLQYADYALHQILSGPYSSELWTMNTTVTPGFASEGWAWTDGKQGILISKFSPGGLEFAVLDRVALPQSKVGFRWGGIGIYRGSPEHGAWLKPGETHQFGVTRVTAYSGDWLQGYYTFRSEMEKRGQGVPDGFNPPFTGTNSTTTSSGGFPATSKIIPQCAKSITPWRA